MRNFIVDSWNGVMDYRFNPLKHIPDLQVRHMMLQVLDKEVMFIIGTVMVMLIELHYLKMIQVANMINHVMSIFVAIILCFVVIYFAHEHDIPRKFFLHGYECSGQIGGGCEKN